MTPDAAFSTGSLPPPARAAAWNEAVAAAYFPLDLAFADAPRFKGALARRGMGDALVSRLRSAPLAYRRRPVHLREGGEESFLLTVPRSAPVRFSQMGREVVCAPGGFLLERGAEPYEFSYDRPCDLIAVKIAGPALSARLPAPGRFCAMGFDGRRGVGALLLDVIRAAEARAAEMSAAAREAVGRQIVELFALAVESDGRALESPASSVRAAHLSRLSAAIGRRLSDPDLGPEALAADCGVSKRYLHALCQAEGVSVRDRVREARLSAARRALAARAEGRSVAEIAYAVGFSDASAFARAYRARFGESPSETRAAARGG
jgi:AraC-like DNA-binding protein